MRAPSSIEAPLLEAYIDDPEYNEFLNGSALVALDTDHAFSGYLFCEPNEERANQLKEAIAEHPRYNLVRIREETAEKALHSRVVNNPSINWKKSKAVCFLDPFALQVRWETLEMLASTRSIEVILNFPLGMALQRLLPQNAAKVEMHRDRLNEYFGSTDWYDQVYETNLDMLGETTRKRANAGEALLAWYCTRLKAIFGYVSRPRLVTNTNGTHLYYLIWAGPHPKGRDIANHILGMGHLV